MSSSSSKQMDTSKYVRYTPEQVEALERVYMECPKPTSLRRQQLIRECPILSNIEPKQIKVWFQNRRCREKQRTESSRLQTVNRKLTAMNKLLMEENDRLQKQVSQFVYENGYMKNQLQNISFLLSGVNHAKSSQASLVATDVSCESVVTTGQHQQQQNPTHQHPQRDANSPAGLLAVAEEALAEFLSKATGTAVNWVQMPGMKPGPDSIGIVAVSPNCSGVAARACGLVSLEPMKIAGIVKDRPSWFRDCRCFHIMNALPAGSGGTIELIYMQICERSLTASTGGPEGPTASNYVRAEMLSSGCLIRPCEGGSSIVHIVDHIDLDASSVPEVLRPLYESPKILAQKMTMAALRHIRQIAQEAIGEVHYGGGRQPAVLRTFSQRLSRGFNDAINGFADDGWSLLSGDGAEDVTLVVNSSPAKVLGSQGNSLPVLSTFGGGILCAKTSMLLQDVPPAVLVRFLREHRSEWADSGVDAYSAASLKSSACAIPCARPGLSTSQVILPLAHTVEHEEMMLSDAGLSLASVALLPRCSYIFLHEFLEVIRLEGPGFSEDDAVLPRDMHLLQIIAFRDVFQVFLAVVRSHALGLTIIVIVPFIEIWEDIKKSNDQFALCSGVDENAEGACAQLVFVPIDETFGDDAPLLPSGFRVIPLEPKTDGRVATRTLDLASALEVGCGRAKSTGERASSSYNLSIVASVQRVAMAIAPSGVSSHMGPKSQLGSPEALTLARWICRSYRAALSCLVNHMNLKMFYTGVELLQVDSHAGDSLLKQLWQHSDAIMCCSLKASPVFTFANQAGLDMLETTLVGLQDIMLDKILDESGRRLLCSEFSNIMQKGYAHLPEGLCISSMGRSISYDHVLVWKVMNNEDTNHCLALMFMNWSFA
ncbi:hypothetical protein Scep_012214 [Stephania cephalantha]|uniref:Uncharacterized protein n=1 Tax=Stephania cephalantha TaxID=152367 RepID=A0AAP0P9N1_9MAGN